MENVELKNVDEVISDDLFTLVENNDFSESEKLDIEPYSYWKSVGREFVKKKSAIFAVVCLTIMILLSIIVPLVSPHPVDKVFLEQRFTAPNGTYWFGTDSTGTDLFTLIWTGARLSIFLAFVVTIINTFFGVLIGGIWGYFRKIDPFMQELYNFITNIPAMLIYIMLLYVFNSLGTPPLFNLIFAMCIIGWAPLARLIRNQMIIFNNREYNIASRTLGSSPSRIIVNNLLPYILSVIITNVSITISGVIGTEVTLSYFGVGLPYSYITLGRILKDSYQAWTQYFYVLFFPALTVGLITICFYLIGLALSDALDPRTHR